MEKKLAFGFPVIYMFFSALPASIAYNYNYGMAERIKTCKRIKIKRIEMGALTFDI
jgi:hypothetical protein